MGPGRAAATRFTRPARRSLRAADRWPRVTNGSTTTSAITRGSRGTGHRYAITESRSPKHGPPGCQRASGRAARDQKRKPKAEEDMCTGKHQAAWANKTEAFLPIAGTLGALAILLMILVA